MRQLGCRTRAPSNTTSELARIAGTNLGGGSQRRNIVAPRTKGLGTLMRTSIRNDTERTVSAAGGSATRWQ